ncbi:MAG: putative entry exclusion protein TrbK-alt [Sphingomonadales bacterium]|nr:putative entry exclusion protein TrbK-alt [Sphingomonadales bacterium]
MDTKLFARIGAVAFVAIAITMTAIELREGPVATPTETITVNEPNSDPLPAQLRACAAMGEAALPAPECRAAWAENQRRFLAPGARPMEPLPQPDPRMTEPAPQALQQPIAAPSTAGGQ